MRKFYTPDMRVIALNIWIGWKCDAGKITVGWRGHPAAALPKVFSRVSCLGYFLLLDMFCLVSVTLPVVWCHFWFCGLEWSLRLWFLERPGLKFWFCYLSDLQFPYLSEGNNTSFRIGVRIKWDNVQGLPRSKCSKMWIKMLIKMQISEMPLARCVYDFLNINIF